ncbi:MAG TPA: hypothetical protein VL123_04730 [Candidatus Udaeobacter sp.]|jgi:predicted  nucleic acid-binding Zn-ribbon protein|nr:hypothetical protein [Candidatus Udaeobacter sp.]
MNEITTHEMTTDLDRLSERIEKAAAVVQQLRDDRERLTRERDELARRLQDFERKLEGQDAAAVRDELGALKRDQKNWQTERRDIASRIETLLKKLERIES